MQFISGFIVAIFHMTLVSAQEPADGGVQRPKKQLVEMHPTLADALKHLGVTPDKIHHVKLVGDEASGTSGDFREMKIDQAFWKRYIDGAKPDPHWVLSGYRSLEIHLKGDTHPKTKLFINEADTVLVEGDTSKTRYLCKGLHAWFEANMP